MQPQANSLDQKTGVEPPTGVLPRGTFTPRFRGASRTGPNGKLARAPFLSERWHADMRRFLSVIALSGLAACAPPEYSGPVVGAAAPAYGAKTLEGDSVSLASLRGKVVLLNLWATWCAPCRHETPFLQSLYEERSPDGLEIVGVSMDTGDARDLVGEFVQEYGVTYPMLVDPQMRGMDVYRVLGLPASFLVDREGVLRWMRFGPVGETDHDFLEALEGALK